VLAFNAWALAAFIAGLDPDEKPAVTRWLREHRLLPDSVNGPREGRSITVQDLAQHKGLPVEFLSGLGLENCQEGVRISYRLIDGTLAPRHRIRTALVAKKGSFWTKGVGATVPYGLWRLKDGRKAGFLVLAEGESDPWALWFHQLPCLGLPGAGTARKLGAVHLEGIGRVYVSREPGVGGATFVAGVAKRLREIGWKGDARCVVLPNAKDPNEMHKQNPDGFKAAFQRAMDNAERLPEAQEAVAAVLPIPYQETSGGLFWLKPIQGGEITIPLTNFTAHIVADIAEDDGADVRHALEIEARLKGRAYRFTVPGSQFANMNWVLDHLGAGAVIYPGSTVRDHARVALQLLSGDVPKRTVFKHLGWRKVEGDWIYLHAEGAEGANGAVAGIEVSVPDSLRCFALPEPPTGDLLIDRVRASLCVLALAPLRVTTPAYAAVWRAVLGQADFSLHLAGATGQGKTELAALLQQHFGPGMDSRNLPASWASTGNSLEALAFHAKDAVLVIDDFSPTGSGPDIQRSHRDGDRVLRAQGNNSGRQRMRADASLKPSKPPRGLILSTGEDIPKGQSLRARILVDELGPTEMDWTKLSVCQGDAANGVFAQVLAAFVRWLAPRYDEVRRNLRAEVAKLREKALASASHKRTPDILANLGFGLRLFFDFAVEVEALTKAEAEDTWQSCWKALGEAATAQAGHQAASDPVRRFLELLTSAIASGRAHVAGDDGSHPAQPPAWGWREVVVARNDERTEWRPQGARVGWVTGDDLFLDPDAAYVAAQALGREAGDTIALTPKTLHKRLHERGLLQAIDQARGTRTVRKMLEGRRREVLHIRGDALFPEAEQSPQETDLIQSLATET